MHNHIPFRDIQINSPSDLVMDDLASVFSKQIECKHAFIICK